MRLMQLFWRLYALSALLLSGVLLAGCPRQAQPAYGVPPPSAAAQPGAADAAAEPGQPGDAAPAGGSGS